MAKPRTTKPVKHPEAEEAPHGRATPVVGPRKAQKKVRPLDGEPAMERPYDSGAERAKGDDNPWQDPGGPEPANG